MKMISLIYDKTNLESLILFFLFISFSFSFCTTHFTNHIRYGTFILNLIHSGIHLIVSIYRTYLIQVQQLLQMCGDFRQPERITVCENVITYEWGETFSILSLFLFFFFLIIFLCILTFVIISDLNFFFRLLHLLFLFLRRFNFTSLFL